MHIPGPDVLPGKHEVMLHPKKACTHLGAAASVVAAVGRTEKQSLGPEEKEQRTKLKA